MTEDFFMRLCDVYGFAPSRALRELVDAAIGQAVVTERHAAARLAERGQRKPLTDEEIDSIWDSEKAFADIYAIARAVERAHGIGGQQ